MADPADDEAPTWIERILKRSTMPIAIGGLLAWFLMLWLMFGEVL